MSNISVNFNKATSDIRPMHAINNCPGVPYHSLFDKLGEAGIPYSRLHDTGGCYGGSRYVDIGNVFPCFDRNPEDPEAYDFAFTDRLFAELNKQGVKPFYRLGESIENYHAIKAYRVFPPKDALKWARICEGIIRHYNEGWADGFHYAIEYWEIWNEPDNEPEMKDNPMWKGTKEEYYHLYEIVSNYLKSKFPDLKIGGYGSCGFYAILGDDNTKWWINDGKCSPRVEYFVEFFHGFMKHITSKEHRSPLDFFSWHSYADIEATRAFARYVREQLDYYGFNKTKSIFNEWTGLLKQRGTAADAATVAAKMLAMQQEKVDLSMYYDGKMMSGYCGLFDPVHVDVFKTYYVFKAFNELYKIGKEVYCETGLKDIYVVAAANNNKAAIMISNISQKAYEVMLDVSGMESEVKIINYTLIDEKHDYETVLSEEVSSLLYSKKLNIPKESVYLIEIK